MTVRYATAIVCSAVFLAGCSTGPRSEVPTDLFMENTMAQYGIGPGGRVAQPQAVVLDEEPANQPAPTSQIVGAGV